MQIALIGLGRMGLNMAKRLLRDQHELVVYDPSATAAQNLAGTPARVASSIGELKNLLRPPRTAWIMVPHGAPTESVITELSVTFEKGDVIIDGGNSHFLTSISRHDELKSHGIHFLDVGVSGGIFGRERGYCLMIGGPENVVKYLEPIFATLAPGQKAAPSTTPRTTDHSSAHEGYYHCGPAGSGHYVKMIHNAIEYGMMQAYAEGLDLLAQANSDVLPKRQRFNFDLREICELWRRGSVINSWLLDLMSNALHKNPTLTEFSGVVPDSGEGRWAMMEAIKQGTPAPSLSGALFTRFQSQKRETLSQKALSALRKEFGGHSEGSAQ